MEMQTQTSTSSDPIDGSEQAVGNAQPIAADGQPMVTPVQAADPAPPPAPGAVDRRSRVVVAIMAGAAFVSSLDLFVVNVAFDRIGADFGVGTPGGPSAADLSWVLTAYAVVYASLLVPFGRLADRYGRRRMFLWGLAVFVVASAACAASGSVAALVGFRVLQAIGAAALTPTSLSLLLAALPPAKRLAGVRFWAATGAVAAAFGPAVGGVLTQLSWRWVFLINLPIGVLLWIMAARRVREVPPDRDATRPDLIGAVMFALAVALVALGLVKSADWGWVDGRTLASFAGGLVLTVAFIARSRRQVAPVISAALIRIPSFRNAVTAMFLFSVAFGANLLLGIRWLQEVWQYHPLLTGFAIVVGPVMVPITTALTQRYLSRIPPGRLAAAGSLVLAISVLVTSARMTVHPDYVAGYLPGWILGGIGVGLALPNLMGGATHDLPPEESATGSGVITMARQIGFVAGVSLLFAIVGSRVGLDAVQAFRETWWVLAGVLVLSALAALRMGTARRRPVPGS
jgi:EmrB/QacA subfamily drug resistance transporter